MEQGRPTAKVPFRFFDLDVYQNSMEGPEPVLPLASDTPEALQRILPKALRFNTNPSKDKVELLDYAIKHIFVPPRLPNGVDSTSQLENALLGLVGDCAESFKDNLEPGSDAHAGWEIICTMLATFIKVHDGELTEDVVNEAVSSMAPGGELSPVFYHAC